MKNLFCLLSLVLCLAACSDSNSDAPSIEDLFLDSTGTVEAGSIVSTSVTFWVAADKSSGEYVTEPQSILVNVPIGTTYVPGSSAIGFQGPREPDAVVNCPNGTESVVYNLAQGEIDDPYDFSDFTTYIAFNVQVQPIASQQKAQGAASLTPFVDPCNVPFEAEVEYFVSGD